MLMRTGSLRRMAGVTLIELMIALLIGSLLLLALVQVFSASRSAYQLSEGLSRVQENARFAVDFLQRDIRMAGHFGCVNDQAHLLSSNALLTHFGTTPPDATNFLVSVQGYEAPGTAPSNTLQLGGSWSPPPAPAPILALGAMPGSDVLVLRFLNPQGAPVNQIVNPGTGSAEVLTLDGAQIEALTGDGVASPTLFGIADCRHVDVFEGTFNGVANTVTVAGAGVGNTDLVGRYTPQPTGQTMLYRAESIAYYVAPGTSGEPALHRARFIGGAYVPEELVEGVESLQLLFGLDRVTNFTPATPPSGYIDSFGAANATWGAGDWRRVGVVQVGLLARSPSQAAATQALDGLNVLGVRFTPPATNDGLYRSSYDTTIALRNRLYGN